MAKCVQKDQSQFSELLYNSAMMNKDQNLVAEKILNLTLQIVCLLTGEDCVIVKKRSEHVTDGNSLVVSEVFCRTQSPITESSANSLTHDGNSDSKFLHPPSTEIPLQSQDVAVCLSMEEFDYLEDNKEQYKDVMKEKHQPLSSLGCETVSPEATRHESDSELSVTDYQDPQEKTIHPDTSAADSSDINTSKRNHSDQYPQHCTEEDEGIRHDYKVEPGDGIFHQQCKEETLPTMLNTDESCNNLNKPEECHIPPYSQNYIEEDDRITQDYQIEPGDGFVPQQCKEEAIPTEISTGESISWEAQSEGQHGALPDAEFVMDNNHVTSSYHGVTFVSDHSFSQSQRKSLTIPDRVGNVHEESSLREPIRQHMGREPSATINMYSNANTSTQVTPEDSSVTYTCKECGSNFTNNLDFLFHQRTHINDKVYTCFQCKACFTNNLDLVTHQRIHKEECGKPFFSKPNHFAHPRFHARKKRYLCSVCGQSFSQATELVKHQKSHPEGKSFACPVCGKCFSYKSNLVTHHRIHTGEKPFVCSICGKSFTQSAHHLAHKRIHTGEKPFSCSDCGKCFTRKSTLRTHQTIHSRPFTCLACGKCFISRSVLVAHQQMIHAADKPFPCS
ncbi:uncharacterized protein WCC33_019336 [Rhinophrynus dorsalis]